MRQYCVNEREILCPATVYDWMTIDEVHSAKNLCVYGRVAVVGVLLYAWLLYTIWALNADLSHLRTL